MKYTEDEIMEEIADEIIRIINEKKAELCECVNTAEPLLYASNIIQKACNYKEKIIKKETNSTALHGWYTSCFRHKCPIKLKTHYKNGNERIFKVDCKFFCTYRGGLR